MTNRNNKQTVVCAVAETLAMHLHQEERSGEEKEKMTGQDSLHRPLPPLFFLPVFCSSEKRRKEKKGHVMHRDEARHKRRGMHASLCFLSSLHHAFHHIRLCHSRCGQVQHIRSSRSMSWSPRSPRTCLSPTWSLQCRHVACFAASLRPSSGLSLSFDRLPVIPPLSLHQHNNSSWSTVGIIFGISFSTVHSMFSFYSWTYCCWTMACLLQQSLMAVQR